MTNEQNEGSKGLPESLTIGDVLRGLWKSRLALAIGVLFGILSGLAWWAFSQRIYQADFFFDSEKISQADCSTKDAQDRLAVMFADPKFSLMFAKGLMEHIAADAARDGTAAESARQATKVFHTYFSCPEATDLAATCSIKFAMTLADAASSPSLGTFTAGWFFKIEAVGGPRYRLRLGLPKEEAASAIANATSAALSTTMASFNEEHQLSWQTDMKSFLSKKRQEEFDSQKLRIKLNQIAASVRKIHGGATPQKKPTAAPSGTDDNLESEYLLDGITALCARSLTGGEADQMLDTLATQHLLQRIAALFTNGTMTEAEADRLVGLVADIKQERTLLRLKYAAVQKAPPEEKPCNALPILTSSSQTQAGMQTLPRRSPEAWPFILGGALGGLALALAVTALRRLVVATRPG